MTEAALEHHKTNRAFYDRISEAYDFISDASEKPARQAGLKALAVQLGEKVLEIGFGTGNEIIDLARLVGSTGETAGIDVSPGMLKVAERKIAEAGLLKSPELVVGDARKLPYPDGSFDAAYTSFTLELFPEGDINAVLAETLRVLRPGGRLGIVCMSVVAPDKKASALEKTYVWMHQHFPHIVDCRPIDAAALVKAAGFTASQAIGLEIWTMPVSAVIAVKPA